MDNLLIHDIKDILVENSEMINLICQSESIGKEEILKNLLEGFKILMKENKYRK
ncbi:MAG: hypothetical protein ACRCYE_05980 [Sarcina sp.]